MPVKMQTALWSQAARSIRTAILRRSGVALLKPTLAYYELDTNVVDGLAGYVYSSAPYVWIDRQLSPFWKTCGALLPDFLHPNTVTMLGFVPALLWFLVFLSRSSAELSECWFIGAALLMFFYQTMDCLDGIQARRLGLSSPLGQLFDHGLDAIVITFGLTFLARALALDEHAHPSITACLYLGGYANFFTTVWRERHTDTGPLKDVMYFGLVGVTSSEFFIMAVLLARAQFMDLFAWVLLGASLGSWIAGGLVVLDVISVSISLMYGLTSCYTDYPFKEPTPDAEYPMNIWGEFSSFLVFMLGAGLFILDNAWAAETAHFMTLSSGAISAYLLQNIILYDMASLPCDRFYTITAVYAVGAILFHFTAAPLVLALVAVVCVIMESMWVFIMFNSLAVKLGINMFAIPCKHTE